MEVKLHYMRTCIYLCFYILLMDHNDGWIYRMKQDQALTHVAHLEDTVG